MNYQYAKISQGIFDSSIWSEPMATRLLWIVMVTMSDKYGDVNASIPGLALKIDGTIEQVQDALAVFLASDKFSRTESDEGRRIEKIDGGWRIINKVKYAKIGWQEDKKERKSARDKKSYAEKIKEPKTVTQNVENGGIHHNTNTNTNIDIDTGEAEKSKSIANALPQNSNEFTEFLLENEIKEIPLSKESAPKKKTIYSDAFEIFWRAYPKRKGKKKSFAYFKKADLPENYLEIIEAQKQQESWNRDNGKFITWPERWLRDERWLDEIDATEPAQDPTSEF